MDLPPGKNGSPCLVKNSPMATGRQGSQNVLKQVPGPTASAARNENTPCNLIHLFQYPAILEIVVQMSTKEG